MDNKPASLRFFFNGIRVAGDRRIWRASYSYCSKRQVLTIYSNDSSCSSFPANVSAAIGAVNNSDSMTDYFVSSRAVLDSTHTHFRAAMEANAKQIARRIKSADKGGRTHSATIARADLAAVELALSAPAPADSHIDFLAQIGAL